MKYPSKHALIEDIRKAHDVLCERLREIPKARWREPGVWGDGWTIADLVAHLAEWQRLFLSWYEDGLAGATPQMPAPGFKWSETPRLNRAIHAKHRERASAAVWADFTSTHRQIVQLVDALSPGQLLAPGHFAWTGTHPLATYLGPNTASHYRFATKVLERWQRTGGILRPGGRGAAAFPVEAPKDELALVRTVVKARVTGQAGTARARKPEKGRKAR